MIAVSDRLEDVWKSRDYPVLRESVRRIDAGATRLRTSELAQEIGMDAADVLNAAFALQRRGLLEVGSLGWGADAAFITEVSGAAYLITGLHPDVDDQLSGLVELLQQAARQQSDEEERTRLRRAAEAVGGV